MESVLIGAAALACPVGMGLMMWFMAKGMRRGENATDETGPVDVDALRAEHARLGEQIDRSTGTDRASSMRSPDDDRADRGVLALHPQSRLGFG
ncbi:MAG: hypothetical protein ACRDK0_15320 [Solirubrobacteraceae bacterium]